MNADSSDDDEDVPEEWVSRDFSHLVIDEEPSVLWDCRENEVEAAYDNISRLLAVICQRNSGSYYDLKSLDRGQGPPFMLQRAFFSLGPCINAFQHCRPILCIDGTFLIGKYRGQMLTTIAVEIINCFRLLLLLLRARTQTVGTGSRNRLTLQSFGTGKMCACYMIVTPAY
jgi:hypothetical protein